MFQGIGRSKETQVLYKSAPYATSVPLIEEITLVLFKGGSLATHLIWFKGCFTISYIEQLGRCVLRLTLYS